MQPEEPVQVPRAHAQAPRESRDALLLENSFRDQAQRPPDRGPCSLPGRRARRAFRPATQAGSKTRGHGLLRRPEVANVLPLGRRRWTDRPAIDSRRAHRDEELTVESRVTSQARSVADLRVQLHGKTSLPLALRHDSPFSDMNVGAAQREKRRTDKAIGNPTPNQCQTNSRS